MTGRAGIDAAVGRPPAASISGPRWRERLDVPLYRAELWPHQSMTSLGLGTVLIVTCAGLCLPLFPVLGTAVFWGLLPFMLLTFLGLCCAIWRNGRNLRISEVLSVWRDEVRVERREPTGRIRRWMAPPIEVRVRLHKDARIEDYLTLTGAGREIELGAFLAPEERVSLAGEVEAVLARAVRG